MSCNLSGGEFRYSKQYGGSSFPNILGKIALALNLTTLPDHQCLQILGSMTVSILMIKWAQWNAHPFQYSFLRQWHLENIDQINLITSYNHQSLYWWMNKEHLRHCHTLLQFS